MQRLRHGLIAAIAIVAVLLGGLQADALGGAHGPTLVILGNAATPHGSADAATSATSAVPTAPDATQALAPLMARVVTTYGATVRVAPSVSASALLGSRCGDLWPVESVRDGWVAVKTPMGKGWVGGGRVVVSTSPPVAECAGARFLPEGSQAIVQGVADCLTLHARPSTEAATVACVLNGHAFTVIDGPVDAEPGEDWFRVSSPSTGTGWALARSLFPA